MPCGNRLQSWSAVAICTVSILPALSFEILTNASAKAVPPPPSGAVKSPNVIYQNKLEVAGVRSAIPAGSVIGVRHCHTGTLWIRQHCGENTSGGMSDNVAEVLTNTVASQLRLSLGGPLGTSPDNNQSLYFRNVQNSSSGRGGGKPRYLVGITIVGAKFDSKQSMGLTGNFQWKTEGTLRTKWEIMDISRNIIVASEDITANSISVPGDNIRAATILGLKYSTKHFLASDSVALLNLN